MASIPRGRAKEASRPLYRANLRERNRARASRGWEGGLRSAREADPRANCEYKSFTRTIRSANDRESLQNRREFRPKIRERYRERQNSLEKNSRQLAEANDLRARF